MAGSSYSPDPESSLSRLEGDNSNSDCDDQQSTDNEEVVSSTPSDLARKRKFSLTLPWA